MEIIWFSFDTWLIPRSIHAYCISGESRGVHRPLEHTIMWHHSLFLGRSLMPMYGKSSTKGKGSKKSWQGFNYVIPRVRLQWRLACHTQHIHIPLAHSVITFPNQLTSPTIDHQSFNLLSRLTWIIEKACITILCQRDNILYHIAIRECKQVITNTTSN